MCELVIIEDDVEIRLCQVRVHCGEMCGEALDIVGDHPERNPLVTAQEEKCIGRNWSAFLMRSSKLAGWKVRAMGAMKLVTHKVYSKLCHLALRLPRQDIA